MNLCRLCAEQKSPLDFNIELSDKTQLNWSYRELIEYHTRVSIKSNKLLPQSVCEDCRTEIDRFAEFSIKLQAIQNTFEVDKDEPDLPSAIKECYVHLEEIIPETSGDHYVLDDIIEKSEAVSSHL